MQSIHWEPVVGYEGLYEVSADGAVRNRHGRIIAHAYKTAPDLYLRVKLYKDAKAQIQYVHRLVAIAFLGWSELPVVRHMDGNPKNNSVSNLQWGTHADNVADSIRHGTQAALRKTHCPQQHEYSRENTANRSGSRVCRSCERARALASYHAKKLRDTPGT